MFKSTVEFIAVFVCLQFIVLGVLSHNYRDIFEIIEEVNNDLDYSQNQKVIKNLH